MPGLSGAETAFVLFAFFLQVVLIIHFAFRRRSMATAIRYGPLVYALGIPAVLISLWQASEGEPWYLWLGGVLFALFALFGYVVEYVFHIHWRSPIVWPIFIPYIALYLSAICFYWWPLATIDRSLWFAYTGLFLVSTVLNVISHEESPEGPRSRLS